jgi:predicted molibdopterin-dependent oxidoreductase YjgC
VPEADAPNVRGAADLGLLAAGARDDQPDVTALRQAVENGQVPALYVLDPGPEGSIGDIGWVAKARQRGVLPLLIVHGVVMSPLAAAADLVLPGAASFEKDACYVNETGLVQGAARVLPPPGEAMEDWQTLVNVAVSIGAPLVYATAAQIRADIAAAMAHAPAYAGLAAMSFSRAVTVRHWLQASNPSEREKWDALFLGLPPLKFEKPGGQS